ncbi:MAG: hypothetical protein LUG18_09335 [Candidatus Azobacteroides sp.]|nr:hypothetical protein [Candidatus Azobacteroides sp.]
MVFKWVDGFSISLSEEKGTVIISANIEGLFSLANHFQELAHSESTDHFHLDQYNSLEDNSLELIVEKR